MEVACSFVLSVSFCQTTGRNIQDQTFIATTMRISNHSYKGVGTAVRT